MLRREGSPTYSRYVPNESGGFDRRAFPTAAKVLPIERPPEPPPEPKTPEPKPQPPRRPSLPAPSGLLPRTMDTEDWLILTVLVLTLLEDGEEPMVALIAAALYLFLQ